MISVCMATFNGEKYIKEQLDSILCQLYDEDEVIISDDGSTDNTLQIIENFDDKRIKLYKNNFRNLIKNFEFTLTQAKGNYIFLSDQDDVWLPTKVEKCMELLSIYNVVLTDSLVVDENQKIIYKSFFSINNSKKGLIHNIIKNSYLGCSKK